MGNKTSYHIEFKIQGESNNIESEIQKEPNNIESEIPTAPGDLVSKLRTARRDLVSCLRGIGFSQIIRGMVYSFSFQDEPLKPTAVYFAPLGSDNRSKISIYHDDEKEARRIIASLTTALDVLPIAYWSSPQHN